MGCGSSHRHHMRSFDVTEMKEERAQEQRPPDPLEELATLYAKGKIDRDTFLSYRERAEEGRLSRVDIQLLREGKALDVQQEDPGVEAELKALSEEIVGLRNQVSALREERARLLVDLERASAKAEGALDSGGLEVHSLFKDKLAKEERLNRLESEYTRLSQSLEKLEHLYRDLEAERIEARVDVWAERVARLKGKGIQNESV